MQTDEYMVSWRLTLSQMDCYVFLLSIKTLLHGVKGLKGMDPNTNTDVRMQ